MRNGGWPGLRISAIQSPSMTGAGSTLATTVGVSAGRIRCSRRSGSAASPFNAHARAIIEADMAGETPDMTTSIDRSRRTFTLGEASAILSRTPATVDALLRGLPDGWIGASEGATTWSPFDVVGHLIHGEQTDWVPRAKIILEHGEARPFDKFNRFAQFSASGGRTLASLLDEFTTLRQESLRALASLHLTDADLKRRGRHPELGVVTFRQLMATWVAHDLDHIVQIARVLARQYSDEVGPWTKYLRIISGTQG